MEELKCINVYIKFLLPNLTSKRRPVDRGIISCINIGYNTIMLNIMLGIFDEDRGYEMAAERRKKHPRGCKGLITIFSSFCGFL